MEDNNYVQDEGRRLELLVKALDLSMSDFSRRLGYKHPSSLNLIKIGRNKISSPKITDKILKRFPRVNYKFLKIGEYPILLEDNSDIAIQSNLMFGKIIDKGEYETLYDMLQDIQDTQKQILKELKNR